MTFEAKKQFYEEMKGRTEDFFKIVKGNLKYREKAVVQSLISFLNMFKADNKNYLLFKVEDNWVKGVGECKAEPLNGVEKINETRIINVDTSIIENILKVECEDLYNLIKKKGSLLNVNVDEVINIIKTLNITFNMTLTGKINVRFSSGEQITGYIISSINIHLKEGK